MGVSALTVALMAAAFALSEMMPMWAASAIVAIVAGIVAWMLIKAGQSALKSRDLSLTRTREQVSRDIKTISERVH